MRKEKEVIITTKKAKTSRSRSYIKSIKMSSTPRENYGEKIYKKATFMVK